MHTVHYYDAVVIFGGGLGVPSALSALREFIKRKRYGGRVPDVVWFMWQCRYPERVVYSTVRRDITVVL